MPDPKKKKKPAAKKNQGRKTPPKKIAPKSKEDRAPDEGEALYPPDEPISDHRDEVDTGMSAQDLRDLSAQIDYQYTCMKAQLKLYERQLCKRTFCQNCRMAKAEARAKCAELQAIQSDIAKALNGQS